MSGNEFILPDPALIPGEQIAMTLTQLAALQSALAARMILARGKEESAQEISQEEELLQPNRRLVHPDRPDGLPGRFPILLANDATKISER